MLWLLVLPLQALLALRRSHRGPRPGEPRPSPPASGRPQDPSPSAPPQLRPRLLSLAPSPVARRGARAPFARPAGDRDWLAPRGVAALTGPGGRAAAAAGFAFDPRSAS